MLRSWGRGRLPGRRLRTIILCALLLVIPLLVLRANLKQPASLNFVDRGVLKVSSPLQAGMTAGIQAVVGWWDGYVNLIHIKRENTRLRAENARLREDAARARRAAAATTRLERLLQLRDEPSASRVAAWVVGADTSPHFRLVRIKLPSGSGAAVRPDMPVVALEGLVGRVRHVYGDYADVQLAVDPSSTFDAVVPRTGAHCLLDGVPGRSRFRCRIEAGTPVGDVEEGDVLVTSQLNAAMPQDVTIGRVTGVERSRGTVHRDAEVVPAVDFGRLSEVLVVLRVAPKPDGAPKGGVRGRPGRPGSSR